MLIRVRDVVGENCITSDDGNKVYLRMRHDIYCGYKVTLDFTDVKTIAAPFLNASVGQLLKDVPAQTVYDNLKFISHPPLSPLLENVVDSVIKHSDRYYNDDRYRKALNTILKKVAADE